MQKTYVSEGIAKVSGGEATVLKDNEQDSQSQGES